MVGPLTGTIERLPRLDRHLSTLLAIKRGDLRPLLAAGRVEVDGRTATNINEVITRFSEVRVDGKRLQGDTARYVMLNKPAGIVSATVDDKHRTVIDLLNQPWKNELHIVGRLDFNSTGLMLLTNDGQWSRRLSLPGSKRLKRYRVGVDTPLNQRHVQAFQRGFHFSYENVTTRPAELRIINAHEAEVGLTEGRYHQIKRMFGHFDITVLCIHRVAVGSLELDTSLAPGQSRELTTAELQSLA